MKPLIQKASCTKTIWGDKRISEKRGIHSSVGAWWEVSAHSHAKSTVKNLPGEPALLDLIQKDEEGMLGKGLTLHEMLRCGYLDAKDDLSIQVHPNDTYALQHSHDYGKYESWYIVEAKPDSTLIAGTTSSDRNTIKKTFQNGTIQDYLKKWEVHTGDYITIPTGMLHALGKGILAFEIGTNSDTTYRFYDYDRKDANGNKRKLHVKESFDVADFSLQPVYVPAKHMSRRIGNTPFFTVDEIFCDKDKQVSSADHFCIITNITEKETNLEWQDERLSIQAYDSVFVPSSAHTVTIEKGSHILLSQPKRR